MKKKLKLKQFFILLAIWFVTVVSVLVGVQVYKHNQGTQFDESAIPYIKQIIPELSQWNLETTRRLMAPEALKGVSEERFLQVLNVFARMGKLQSIEEPEFKNVYSEEETKLETIVVYTIDAQYEHGGALVTIQLLARNNTYEVFRFELSSETLTE